MIKPDGVQRSLVGEIIKRFEQKGFKLVALKMARPTKEHLEQHYADLSGRGFFAGLISYMVMPVTLTFSYKLRSCYSSHYHS